MAHLADINDRIAALATKVTRSENAMALSIRDLQDQAAATLQQLQAETDVANAVKKVVDDQNATIDSLKKQVDDLVAAGGASPADLQQLSDTLLSIKNLDTSNAQIVASAVTAGTQPPGPPPGTTTGTETGTSTDQTSTGPQAG
ncbi:hypothetical protein QA640_08970 [Bradyrhizobium sp. CB82]|uniref:hypothetical protein n=1 Tax=Bradyrhizobium sp. CB82 TaxID=3039159 RepID=UPI0024B0CE4E|nr:hypothetical protein [Bradyrhizobium sp. CB82]WFU42576.1 hypothetical protein QA640_08970 [Bradyrhizobium sp. CB82]